VNLRWCLPLLAGLAGLAAGCPLTVSEEVYPPVTGEKPIVEAERPIPYENFLVLMDGGERQAFFDLRTKAAKDRFIKEHGIHVKRMLADNIRLGMSSAAVEKILGRPERVNQEECAVTETGRYPRVVDEWWVYQRPDTGNLVFIPFRRGWVVEWLLEPDVRQIVLNRPSDGASRKKKESLLIHIGENMPSLIRRPDEDREEYVARMKSVAPVLFSKGPPTWPEAAPIPAGVADLAKTRVGKEEVYSWWGNTSKLYETPEVDQPATYFRTSYRWTYKIFNDFGFTYYSLLFADDRLVEWEVESDIAR
jgi:hypothetical protein